MSVELSVFVILMVFAGSMWIPYVYGAATDPNKSASDFSRPVDLATLRPWVHRAHRAQLNLLEQALPFGALLLVVHILDISTAVTSAAAIVFLVARLIHAFGMVSGITLFPARSIIFNIGWLCILVVAWQIFANA